MTREGSEQGSIERPSQTIPFSDKEVRDFLTQDTDFNRSLQKTKERFLGHWNKYLRSKAGMAFKSRHPDFFSIVDTDSIALDAAEKAAFDDGFKVFRHNDIVGKKEWKYGFSLSYEDVVDLCVNEVGGLEAESKRRTDSGLLAKELGMALEEEEDKKTPVYGEYETDDVSYDIHDEGTEVGKWNNGLYLEMIADEIILTLTGHKASVGRSFLIMDFPSGPITLYVHKEIRPGNKQALVFSFQEKDGKVRNYEMVLPNDESAYGLEYKKTLASIAQEEIVYRKSQRKSQKRREV